MVYGEEGTASIVYRHITNIPSPRISQTTPPPPYNCHRGEETEWRHFFAPSSLSLSLLRELVAIYLPPLFLSSSSLFLGLRREGDVINRRGITNQPTPFSSSIPKRPESPSFSTLCLLRRDIALPNFASTSLPPSATPAVTLFGYLPKSKVGHPAGLL